MPAPRKRGNAQRRSFTTIFSNEQQYLSLTVLSRDIADAELGTQSNVFERCVTSSLLPSRAAERYAAMLYARDEPLGVLECIEALARELSIAAGEPASEEGLVGFVRYAYDYAAGHRVEIGPCAARKALAADLEALVDHFAAGGERRPRGRRSAPNTDLGALGRRRGGAEGRAVCNPLDLGLPGRQTPRVPCARGCRAGGPRRRWDAHRRRPVRQMGVHLRGREDR